MSDYSNWELLQGYSRLGWKEKSLHHCIRNFVMQGYKIRYLCRILVYSNMFTAEFAAVFNFLLQGFIKSYRMSLSHEY